MLMMDFVAPAQKSYCAEVLSVSASLNFTLLFAELFGISISFSNDFLSFLGPHSGITGTEFMLASSVLYISLLILITNF